MESSKPHASASHYCKNSKRMGIVMKKTPWFPGNTHPVRDGYYERDHRSASYLDRKDCKITRDKWLGVSDKNSILYPGVWYVIDVPYTYEHPITGKRIWVDEPLEDASRQDLPWRGIRVNT